MGQEDNGDHGEGLVCEGSACSAGGGAMIGDLILRMCHLIFTKLTVKLAAHPHIFVC